MQSSQEVWRALKTASASAVLALVLATQAHAQPVSEAGVDIPQRRIDAWVYDGADRTTLIDTLASIEFVEDSNAASWVSRWTAVAEASAEQAETLRAVGKPAEASVAYFSASTYYIIAGFPEYATAAQKNALTHHVEMYEKGGALMEEPLQINLVQARGQSFKTYFNRPKGVEKPPLVLWTGGTDKFKGHYYSTVKRLLGMGYAVATFDLPGTGENTTWPLTPDGEFVHKAVLDYYADRNDIDGLSTPE
jgi:esterase FrsA